MISDRLSTAGCKGPPPASAEAPAPVVASPSSKSSSSALDKGSGCKPTDMSFTFCALTFFIISCVTSSSVSLSTPACVAAATRAGSRAPEVAAGFRRAPARRGGGERLAATFGRKDVDGEKATRGCASLLIEGGSNL